MWSTFPERGRVTGYPSIERASTLLAGLCCPVTGLPTMPELGVVAIASKTHFTNGSLGVSQGNHWVHFRRAPGRNVAG
jgi:hypothetical protein